MGKWSPTFGGREESREGIKERERSGVDRKRESKKNLVREWTGSQDHSYNAKVASI